MCNQNQNDYLNYTTLAVLNEKDRSQVSLIQDEETGAVYLRRRLTKDYDCGIYEELATRPVAHTPQIHAVFSDEGYTYIIEEYIQGISLADKIALEGKVSEKQTLEWACKLCTILKELHQLNPPIVHRDIKPSNVLLTDEGELYLIDFDIARQYKEGNEADTIFMGTRRYAAPEQYGYAQTDARSDIYSLGMLMSALLTGDAEAREEPANVNPSISAIIKKCTQVDAKKRHASIDGLQRRLKYTMTPKSVKTLLKVLPVVLLGILLIGTAYVMQAQKVLEGGILSASPNKVIAEYYFTDQRVMEIKNIHNIEFYGDLIDKAVDYDTSFDKERRRYRIYIYLSDPDHPFQKGDKLKAIFGRDTFQEGKTYYEVDLTLAELADTDLPVFALKYEVLFESKERLEIQMRLDGDNSFVQVEDFTLLMANYGMVTERPHAVSVDVSEDGKSMLITYEAKNGAEFENGEDLSIVYLPEAFTTPMRDNCEALCILTGNIKN